MGTSTRAVLFDFDGVIADTENHHIAAWQRTLGGLGWEVADEVAARSMEQDDRIFLAELFEERKIKGGDVEGWVLRKQEVTRSLLADAPRVYPGVKALVERLQGVVRLGVVTTTWRENVEAVLRRAGLKGAFELVVAKEDVVLPKPDPECYRLAIQLLRLRAGEVVALEDSPGGLAAALAAGVRGVAVGHRRVAGPWVGDAPYLPDLRSTEAVVGTLGLSGGRGGSGRR